MIPKRCWRNVAVRSHADARRGNTCNTTMIKPYLMWRSCLVIYCEVRVEDLCAESATVHRVCTPGRDLLSQMSARCSQ